jgi:hypothetical protein
MTKVVSLPLNIGSPGDGGSGVLSAIAEEAATASITTIGATTVNNTRMRFIDATSFSRNPPRVMGCSILYKEDDGTLLKAPHCQNYLISAVGGT